MTNKDNKVTLTITNQKGENSELIFDLDRKFKLDMKGISNSAWNRMFQQIEEEKDSKL